MKKKEKYSPSKVEEIRHSIYADYMLLSGNTNTEIQMLKEIAITIFKEVTFSLHIWHSNDSQLEKEAKLNDPAEESYAKQQLDVDRRDIKLLGLLWGKVSEVISIQFQEQPEYLTKRSLLSCLASFYDPMGVLSPVTLIGRILFVIYAMQC